MKKVGSHWTKDQKIKIVKESSNKGSEKSWKSIILTHLHFIVRTRSLKRWAKKDLPMT